MYKIKDFDADGLVEISLLCEENIDKEMFTRWDLYSSEIDLGEVECEFEKKPSEEEVEQHINNCIKNLSAEDDMESKINELSNIIEKAINVK